MGAVRCRAADRAGRARMRSPGRPPVGRREHRQRFWAAIARGVSSEVAAAAAGVSAPVGVRWFREGGGMPSVSLRTPVPSGCMTKMSPHEMTLPGSLSRFERTTMSDPSGDQPAAALMPTASVMRRRPLPSSLTTQTSKSPTCDGRIVPSVQLKASREPSGDQLGYSSMPVW